MRADILRCPLLFLLFGLLGATAGRGDENQRDASAPSKQPFALKIIDEAGSPVAAAEVGLGFELDATSGAVVPRIRGTTDRDGVAVVSEGRELLPHDCVVVRHAARKLIAVESLEMRIAAAIDGDPVRVTLRPECRVSGRVTCADLTERNRKQGRSIVRIYVGGCLAAVSLSNHDDPPFEFVLPPG